MSLNPLSIAHLGIARRPIVAALLGLWPDAIVPPLPVYALPVVTGGAPARQRFVLPVRILRARMAGSGSTSAKVAFALEVGRAAVGTGRLAAAVAAGAELARQLAGIGSSRAAVSWRRVAEPVFSNDELAMFGVFAFRRR